MTKDINPAPPKSPSISSTTQRWQDLAAALISSDIISADRQWTHRISLGFRGGYELTSKGNLVPAIMEALIEQTRKRYLFEDFRPTPGMENYELMLAQRAQQQFQALFVHAYCWMNGNDSTITPEKFVRDGKIICYETPVEKANGMVLLTYILPGLGIEASFHNADKEGGPRKTIQEKIILIHPENSKAVEIAIAKNMGDRKEAERATPTPSAMGRA